jgi:prepilin-type N-terminal cleavage/methylation domain-containing protein
MFEYKQKPQNCSSSESGFTIIESLVAILVVAILLAAIAPVIALSTATRVQSRRVELATQAARTYIDGVRTGAITVPFTTTLPTTGPSRSITSQPEEYLINPTNMPVPTASTGLYCYNKDGSIVPPDCTSNLFYIQARRFVQTTGTNDGYRLGIRIYRSDVDFSKPLTASDSVNKKMQNSYTGSLGNRQAPLVEMTTDIASKATSFNALCQRLGSASGTCN